MGFPNPDSDFRNLDSATGSHRGSARQPHAGMRQLQCRQCSVGAQLHAELLPQMREQHRLHGGHR